MRFLLARAVLLFALAGCTRGERAAPPSAGDRPTAAPNQAPSTMASQLPSRVASPLLPATLGFDSVVKQQLPTFACYTGARYVVVERERLDDVGADLFVRPRGVTDAAPRCDTDSLPGDIVFRTGAAAAHHPDAQHFMGLKGDLLIAWDGTGGASDLYIYDLNKRAQVFYLDDVDDVNLEWRSATTVAIWVTKGSEKAAVAAGCPDTLPGNPAQMDSLMSLDLQTLVLRPTGRSRCGVGQ